MCERAVDTERRRAYAGNAEATREALTPDGWLKTGDVVCVDAAGFMTVVDRRKELVKYRGFQVAPAELESLLTTHPRVMDAGVIGVMSASGDTELPRCAACVSLTSRRLTGRPQGVCGAALACEDRRGACGGHRGHPRVGGRARREL